MIAYLAYQAYRWTGLSTLKWFAVGFGFITLGFLFGGGLHQLLGTDVLVGVLAQTSLTGLGFGVLAYSLYTEDPDRADRVGKAERFEA